MLLTCAQMQAAEEAVFESGASAEQLMERAGLGIARGILEFFPDGVAGSAIIFVGNGHNGGDALVAARHLADVGWDIFIRLIGTTDELKPLTHKKLTELEEDAAEWDGETGLEPDDHRPVLLVDGLLGIGARGPLRPGYHEAAIELNQLRVEEHALCFAVDIPSGVDGDTGQVHRDAVEADVTLTIAHAKPGLVASEAVAHVGRIVVVPLDRIAPLDGQFDDSARVLTARSLARLLPRRSVTSYKTQMGRVAVIAGSRGLVGAAVLSSTGALRAGAGLVTLIAEESIYPLLVANAPAEVMVKPVSSYGEVGDMDFDALAIGPGLGADSRHADSIVDLIVNDPRPAVIDADGLNMLAARGADVLADAGAPRLLTPHPGEMRRLAGDADADAFVSKHAVTLLLKGAHTEIHEAGKPVSFNTTGHPGMATGGIGDVLTGICGALLGQGLSTYDGACIGAWLSGRAAEIGVYRHSQSVESFVASDVIAHLGAAFDSLRQKSV